MTLPFAATSPSEPLLAGSPRLQRSEGVARIAFKSDGGRTRLYRLYQSGCANVRFPKDGGRQDPEAVLINTAGGMTGGDRLCMHVELAGCCRAVVTTQACEKIYRSPGGAAELTTSLTLGEGARLDWLPQETILFDGARLRRRVEAELAPEAELLLIECAIFGRSASGETVEAGLFADRWRIRREGRLVFADDLRFDWTDGNPLRRPATLAGCATLATILFVGREPEARVAALRTILGDSGGVTTWGGKLLARIVEADGNSLRARLIPALAALRDGAPLPTCWRI